MCVIVILCNLNYSNISKGRKEPSTRTYCSTLCGRIKGTACSIISVLRMVGIYSTGGEFIAQWVETDLRSTSRKSCLNTVSSCNAGIIVLVVLVSMVIQHLASPHDVSPSRPHPSHNNSRISLTTVL